MRIPCALPVKKGIYLMVKNGKTRSRLVDSTVAESRELKELTPRTDEFQTITKSPNHQIIKSSNPCLLNHLLEIIIIWQLHFFGDAVFTGRIAFVLYLEQDGDFFNG